MQPNMQTNRNVTVTQTFLTMRIVWGALLVSQAMYMFVSYQTTTVQPTPEGFEPSVALITPLAIAAAVCFGIALWIPKLIVSATKRKPFQNKPISTEVLRVYYPAFIVQLAMFESVAIFGLVLSMQTREFTHMLPFVAISVLGFLSKFPTSEKVVDFFNS